MSVRNRLLPLVAAFVVLWTGSTTALYYLELERMEKSLAAATEAVLRERLGELPGLEVTARFSGRDGEVAVVVPSAEDLGAAREAVDVLVREKSDRLPYALASLRSDLRRRPSFHVFEEEGAVCLRAHLPVKALTALEDGVAEARGVLPRPPRGSQGAEDLAVPQEDAAEPDWQDTVGTFASFFFQPGRAQEAGVRVVDGLELVLQGRVESEEERTGILRYAETCFPSLASRIQDDLQVARRVQPLVIYESEGIISVEGMVGSQEEHDRLFESVRSQGEEGQSFVNGLQVTEGIPPVTTWFPEELTFLGPLLADVPQLYLTVGSDDISIRGQAASRERAEDLVRQLEAVFQGRAVKSALSYPGAAVSLAGDVLID